MHIGRSRHIAEANVRERRRRCVAAAIAGCFERVAEPGRPRREQELPGTVYRQVGRAVGDRGGGDVDEAARSTQRDANAAAGLPCAERSALLRCTLEDHVATEATAEQYSSEVKRWVLRIWGRGSFSAEPDSVEGGAPRHE